MFAARYYNFEPDKPIFWPRQLLLNKKESLGDIERENEFLKTLFGFTEFQETSSPDRINKILSFIQNSKNGPNYFIKLIDHYSLCRPQYPNISKLFVKCIFFCFQETHEPNNKLLNEK